MTKLFLDDVRNPPDSSWSVVRSYDEFVKFVLDNGVPDVVSFDHDLAIDHYPFFEQSPTHTIPYDSYTEKTGYHAAQWLVGQGYPKIVIVHTQNPVGAMNIINVFATKTYTARLPYPNNEKVKF